MTTIQERMAARTNPKPTPTGCLLWIGYLSRGYGQVRSAGRILKAHRVAWELVNGSIPEGLVIDHLCRVRNCVNPAHMRVVTPLINTLAGEGVSAKCVRRATCLHGHNDWMWKERRGRPVRVCRVCKRDRKRQARRAKRGDQ